MPTRQRDSLPPTDNLEAELAEAIVAAAERASGLSVRVGIADGKFAAYVAAVMAGATLKGRAPAGARDSRDATGSNAG